MNDSADILETNQQGNEAAAPALSKSKKKRNRRNKKKAEAAAALQELPLAGCDDFPIKLMEGQDGRGRRVVAARPLAAGATVLRCRAHGLAAHPADAWRAAACLCCLAVPEDRIFRCGGCGLAHYCSERCQRADAPLHARECAALGALREEGAYLGDAPQPGTQAAAVRVAVRCAALAAKEEADGVDQARPLHAAWPRWGHVAGLAAPAAAAAAEDPEAGAELARAAGAIAQTLSNHFEVTQERIQFLLQAIQSNAHGVRVAQPGAPLMALGLFPLGSMLNHACTPNAHHHFLRRRHQYPVLEFRATRPIAEGEEICYGYCDLYQTKEGRHKLLQGAYRFTCECPRCERALGQGPPPSSAEEEEEGSPLGGRPGWRVTEAMVGGCVCPDAGCAGVVVPDEGSEDENGRPASFTCDRCGKEESGEAYWARLRPAAAAAVAALDEAAQFLGHAGQRGPARDAALAARAACLRALARGRAGGEEGGGGGGDNPAAQLHPHHGLALKLNVLLAKACEMALAENARLQAEKEAAAAAAAAGGEESGSAAAAAAAEEEEEGDPAAASPAEERALLLRDKATACAAAYKAMATCIGGNQPEIAEQLLGLAGALAELGFNRWAAPAAAAAVATDGSDHFGQIAAAGQLAEKARAMLSVCFGDEHEETKKASSMLQFIGNMTQQMLNPASSSSNNKGGGKKKKKNSSKKKSR